jgi:uncharacterized repeat protein (TIGR03803 family)
MHSKRVTGMALAICFFASSASYAATERILHRFKGGVDGAEPIADLLKVGNSLYGTTEYGGLGPCEVGKSTGCGTVFVVTPSDTKAAVETVAYAFQGGSDGAYPHAGLINVNGTFYGTTYAGGASGDGTVFSLTSDGVETVLYSFKGGSDGANPASGLIEVGGTLYGLPRAEEPATEAFSIPLRPTGPRACCTALDWAATARIRKQI